MRATTVPAARAAKLAEANELARQRATQWALVPRDSKGEQMAAMMIVDAGSEERAIVIACDQLGVGLQDVRAPKAARPLLKSSEWRSIYEEVGLH